MSNRIATLDPSRARAARSRSRRGTPAQAYAWAGRAAGVPVTVVMPAGAVRSKVDACLGYGAGSSSTGAHVGETFAEMERIRDERGLTYCHPFDDPAVIAGHGTVGLEILEDLPDVDVVVVGVGGGGLISGVAAALKGRRPAVRVYGVEPERLECAVARARRGRDRPDPARSASPTAGCAVRGRMDARDGPALPRWRGPARRRDDPGRHALRPRAMKQVLEPAGAAALAAVLSGRVPIRDGERVAVVLSGGNVEIGRLGELLGGAGSSRATG